MKIFGISSSKCLHVFWYAHFRNPDAEYPALSKSATGSDRFLPNVFSSFLFFFFFLCQFSVSLTIFGINLHITYEDVIYEYMYPY